MEGETYVKISRGGSPLLVFGACALLYLSGLASGPAGGDTGELLAVAAAGGVAHPPGYPLYTLLLRAVSVIPVASLPERASGLSALFAAGAVAVLYAALRRQVGGWAALAVGALALSLGYWRLATVAEVFAGAALVEALLVAVAFAVAEGWRGPGAAAALGGVGALGLAHHHTIIGMAPLGLWILSRLLAEPAGRGRVAVALGAALLPGLLIYGALLLPGGGWRWGDPRDLGDLAHLFFRIDYGTGSLTVGGDTPGGLHLLAFFTRRPMEWHLWFVVPVIVGVWTGVRGDRRGLWGALLLSWALVGPALVSRFHTALDHGAFLQRFYLLSDVLLAPFAALGLAELGRARRGLVAFTSAAALALGGLQSAAVAPHAARETIPAYVRAVLEALPAGAIMVVDGDTPMSALLYAQEGERRRRDVVVVAEGLLGVPWYAAWAARGDGALEALLRAETELAPFLARARGRAPVYLTASHARRADLAAAVGPLVPTDGLMVRLLGPGEVAPPLEALVVANAAAAARLDLGPPPMSPLWRRRTEEAWPAGQAALVWWALSGAAERQGLGALAERCRARAEVVRPDVGAEGGWWF